MIDYNSELKSERNFLVGITLVFLFFFSLFAYCNASEYYLYEQSQYLDHQQEFDWKIGGIDFDTQFNINYANAVNYCASSTIMGDTGYILPNVSQIYNKFLTYSSSSLPFYSTSSTVYTWLLDESLYNDNFVTGAWFRSSATYLLLTLTGSLSKTETTGRMLNACIKPYTNDVVIASSSNSTIIGSMGTTTEAFTQLKGINLGLGIICTILFIFVATYTFNHFSAKGKDKWPY